MLKFSKQDLIQAFIIVATFSAAGGILIGYAIAKTLG